MFQIDDEFDVDDDFLGDVFGAENKENPWVDNKVDESPQCLKADGPTSSSSVSYANQSFLNAWKSHDDLKTPRNAGNRTLEVLQGVKATNVLDSSPVSNGSLVKNVRTRKFPGPAGLLPERQGNSSLIATEEFLLDLENEKKDMDVSVPEVGEVLSQDSSRCFELGCWGTMLRDLGAGLASGISVKGVRSKARHSRSLKVPAMALLLQSVDPSTPDPCLTLRDTTGEMYGTLHRDVWEQYGDRLEPGAVLVLRSVGVISAGITSKRHYLNITANNIATIYCANGSAEEVLRININPILRGDLPRLLDEWETLVVAPPPNLLAVPTPPQSPRMFTTVTDGNTSRTNQQRANHTPPVNRQLPIPPRMNRSFGAPPRPSSFRAVAAPRPGSAPDQRPVRPPRPPPSSLAPRQQQTLKRPRFEPAPTPTSGSAPDIPQPRSIFSVALDNRESSSKGDVLENLFDGIDTDSLFGDF
ncbi:hypothetical protein AAG570_002720 [Ranatra chinensis]|uniref:Homologous recombination OB-fold protein OB-fold domain-containing protein n=1 Tax=Ranatra chinensis TaxID=642074 RepID=A0ABD0YWT8_9HEMI